MFFRTCGANIYIYICLIHKDSYPLAGSLCLLSTGMSPICCLLLLEWAGDVRARHRHSYSISTVGMYHLSLSIFTACLSQWYSDHSDFLLSMHACNATVQHVSSDISSNTWHHSITHSMNNRTVLQRHYFCDVAMPHLTVAASSSACSSYS